MTADELRAQLDAIEADPDFADRSGELTAAWRAAGVGVESVEPVLRFMESHPAIDYGVPGALTHFVEQFDGGGYEASLLASIARRPTAHTVWLLNRLINGTRDSDTYERYIDAMWTAEQHPAADDFTRDRIRRFLARLLA